MNAGQQIRLNPPIGRVIFGKFNCRRCKQDRRAMKKVPRESGHHWLCLICAGLFTKIHC